MPTRRPLDILYLGMLPPHRGGAAVSTSQILIGLARLGHTIRSISHVRHGAYENGDEYAAMHPELSVRRFEVPFDHNQSWVPAPPDFQTAKREGIRARLGEALEERRPDLVFLGHEDLCSYAVAHAGHLGVPIMLRPPGPLTMAIEEGWYPEPLASEVLKGLRTIDLICPQAEHMADRLRRLGVERVKTIPNIVDLRQFAPREAHDALRCDLSIAEGHAVVLHMSNMKPMKRPDDIVRAAPAILAREPCTTFVIIGTGPARDTAESLCREKRLTSHFRFVDWIEYEEVPAWLNCADIIVMPSEFEHQARLYLETQACGRVLVASDVPGAREVVDDGETGLLFRMGDAKDLADKVVAAISDPALRVRMGREARRLVARHGVDEVVSAYSAAMYGITDVVSETEESCREQCGPALHA